MLIILPALCLYLVLLFLQALPLSFLVFSMSSALFSPEVLAAMWCWEMRCPSPLLSPKPPPPPWQLSGEAIPPRDAGKKQLGIIAANGSKPQVLVAPEQWARSHSDKVLWKPPALSEENTKSLRPLRLLSRELYGLCMVKTTFARYPVAKAKVGKAQSCLQPECAFHEQSNFFLLAWIESFQTQKTPLEADS